MPFGVCCGIQKTNWNKVILWQILKTRVEKQVNEMLIKKQTVTVEVLSWSDSERMEEIDQSTRVTLVRSMLTRLNETIEGNNNKINY